MRQLDVLVPLPPVFGQSQAPFVSVTPPFRMFRANMGVTAFCRAKLSTWSRHAVTLPWL
jgi:hypothetical protein